MTPILMALAGALAVWRITRLAAAEPGPWNLFETLRQRTGLAPVCFDCASLWLALPAALLFRLGWIETLLIWPALSAGAMLIERWSERPGLHDQARWHVE